MFTASFKLIQPCPLPANLVLLCYYCSLLSPCLVCMLRMLRCYPVTPGFGISHYYIVVDDMIIIMLTLYSTKDGRSRLSRPDALFHSSHLGSEFRVLVTRLSVPNRVRDAMGSPFLTYLVQTFLEVAQANLPFETVCVSGLQPGGFKTTR